jgi:hypothetical protein
MSPAATSAIRTICGALSVALAVAVMGCGGGSEPDKPAATAKPAADDRASMQRLLGQIFGPNRSASSGLVTGTIDIDVEGVPRWEQPIQLSMSGPFSQEAGGAPQANLSLGVQLRDTAYGAELILLDDEVLLGLGSTAYEIPDSISTPIRRPLRDSDNALGSLLAVFALNPRRWVDLSGARILGDERLDGVSVDHGTAPLDKARFFTDAARFTRVLTSLRLTDITGLPRVLGPRVRAALVRSVTSATGHLYAGAEDHVIRKARFDVLLEPSAADRRQLGGITRMKVVGNLTVTDIGARQQVEAPSARGSYSALQLTMDALEESIRRDEREGK